jgi:hypothetical protein
MTEGLNGMRTLVRTASDKLAPDDRILALRIDAAAINRDSIYRKPKFVRPLHNQGRVNGVI